MTSVLDHRPAPAEHSEPPGRPDVDRGRPRRRSPRPWLALVPAGLGLVSALWGLGRRDLWLDESYSLGAVHQLPRTLEATHATMAAYYALLRPWATVSESAAWLRGLSALLAVAAVVIVVRLVRRARGPRVAAAVGLLTVLSPMWLTQAREARSYGLVLVLVATAWLALDRALDADGTPMARRWWALHTAVCVVLPLAHGLALAQLIPHLAAVGLAGAPRRTWWRCARGLAAATAVTAALALHGAADEVGDWVAPLDGERGLVVLRSFTTPHTGLALAVLGVLLVGAGHSLRTVARTPVGLDRARAALPILWGALPIAAVAALSVVRPSFVPRYLVGSVPGVALLLVAAVDGLLPRPPRALRDRSVRVVALSLVALPLTIGHLGVHQRSDTGWSDAATVVAEGLRTGDTVLLARTPTTRPPFEAAWRDVDPTTTARLVPSDRPLGQVRRFEPVDVGGTVRWNEARAADRLWVVGDVERGELDRLPSLTVDGVAGRPASHREVGRWILPGARATVVVVLLVPR